VEIIKVSDFPMDSLKTLEKLGKIALLRCPRHQANKQERLMMMARKNLREAHRLKAKKIE